MTHHYYDGSEFEYEREHPEIFRKNVVCGKDFTVHGSAYIVKTLSIPDYSNVSEELKKMNTIIKEQSERLKKAEEEIIRLTSILEKSSDPTQQRKYVL